MSACWIHPKAVPDCRLCARTDTSNLHPHWALKLTQAQEKGVYTCLGPWRSGGDASVVVNGKAVCGCKFYRTVKQCPSCGTMREN